MNVHVNKAGGLLGALDRGVGEAPDPGSNRAKSVDPKTGDSKAVA